jgi:hypothetical protein
MQLRTILFALVISTTQAWSQTGSTPPPPFSGIGNNNSNNGPIIDPTKNVLDLVGALKEMLKEIRISDQALLEAKFNALEKHGILLASSGKDLREAVIARIDSENKITREFTEKLLGAEAKRIDALRAVDVAAVTVANQRTSEQATALQTQTTASAEVLRNQVARSAEDLRALVQTTATTQLANQQQQFNAVIGQIAAVSVRVTTLEQSGAEGKGRQAPPDPQIAGLIARNDTLDRELRLLREQTQAKVAVDTGQGQTIGYFIAGLMFIFAMIGTIATIITVIRKPHIVGVST